MKTGKRKGDVSTAGSLQIDYSFPGPVAQDFVEYMPEELKVYNLIKGPWGSGKSVASVIKILTAAAQQKPGPDGIRRSRWAIVRRSYRFLKSTTIKTWHEWVPRHLGVFRQSDSPIVHHIQIGDIDLEVLFFPLRDEDDVGALLSLELTGIWFNEVREVPWQLVKDAMGRCARYPPRRVVHATFPQCIMDTNPPTPKHWIPVKYAKMCKEHPDSFRYYRQPSGRGPYGENVDNLAKNYYQDLVRDNTEEWVNVYVDGEDGNPTNEHRIYPAFKASAHVKPDLKPIPSLPIHIGVDLGLSPGVVFGQELPFGSWIILAEITGSSYHIQDLCGHIKNVWNHKFRKMTPGRGTFDPAGKARNPLAPNLQSSWDMLVDQLPAFDWEPAYTQDPIIRWQAVSNLLQRQDGFGISDDCSALIEGFAGGYRFKTTQTGEVLERAEKDAYSDIHDALQYLILGGEASALVLPDNVGYSAPHYDDDLQLEVPRV